MSATSAEESLIVPARVLWLGETPLVEMRRISGAALAQAFWDDIVAKAPIVTVLPLDAQTLPEGRVPLRGAIFHTYRCGSTLLCRQMSALPGVYAAAEPSFLSQLVFGGHNDPQALRDRILKLVALLSGGLGVPDIVIKWPGLLADRAGALVAALPDVPMLFLHRDPVEVLASIERAPLGNIVAALETVGLSMPSGETGETASAAVVIAHLCRCVAAVPPLRRMDYARLDPARVARHFGLPSGPRWRRRARGTRKACRERSPSSATAARGRPRHPARSGVLPRHISSPRSRLPRGRWARSRRLADLHRVSPEALAAR